MLVLARVGVAVTDSDTVSEFLSFKSFQPSSQVTNRTGERLSSLLTSPSST